MPRIAAPKTNLILLFRILVVRLNVSVLRLVADDNGIVGHVKLRSARTKKSYQFQGTSSIFIKRQLPPKYFGEVIEVLVPSLAVNHPLLSGNAKADGQDYVWTLEPITGTLIVRMTNGPIKFQEKHQLRRNGYTPGLLRQKLVPESKGDPRPGRQ